MRLVLRAAHRKLHHNPTECQDCCASNHSLDFYFVNPENGSISVDQLWGRCNLHWKWMKNASEIGSPVSSCFCSFRVNKSTPHRKPPRTGRSGRRQLTCGHRPASRSPCPLSTRNLTDSPVLQKQSATSFHSMNDLCFHFVIFHKRINLSMKFRWKYANEVRYHLSAAIH